MKRMITLLTALLLLMSFLIPTVGATKAEVPDDSSYVPYSIREQYEGSQATLISVFTTNWYFDHLQDPKSIEDLIDRIHMVKRLHYMVCWEDGTVDYLSGSIDSEGNYKAFKPGHPLRRETLQFYLHNDLTAYLGSDVIITQKYLLHHHYGTRVIIIYRTNKGDYIYYEDHDVKPCLFSADNFLAYDHLGNEIGNNFCNLSKYTLGSPSFDPNAKDIPWIPSHIFVYFSVGSLLLIAGILTILVIIYRKKYKAHNPYEENHGKTFPREFVVHHTLQEVVEATDEFIPPPN